MSDSPIRSIKIGRRLRSERRRLGMGQAEVAAIAGVGRNAQYRYETDERMPDAEYLRKLHDAGIDVMYVISGKQRSASAGDNCLRIDRTTLLNLLAFAAEDDASESEPARAMTRRIAYIQLLSVFLAERLGEPLSLDELRNIAGEMARADTSE